jgi:hypothetical protein
VSVDPLAPRHQPVPGAPRDRAAARRRTVLRLTPEPTFHARFECKYIIDPAVVPALREFLRPHTEPDQFAAVRPGYRYPICSLYLDSPNLSLYEQTVCGEKDRFKLRVRSYSDDPSTPVFFEVKRKMNNVVHKRRAVVSRRRADALLTHRRFDVAGLDGHNLGELEYFDSRASLIEARPVVRIRYMREAYQSKGNEPVRVTLDTELAHAITLDGALSLERGRWTATPTNGTILEIKFTERFPWWIQDLIRQFALNQRAVPKYIMSVDHMLMDGRESALALAGITLPPIRRS